MKLFPEKILLLTLLVLSLSACKKNYVISDKQVILFQFEYINYAWGYQHNGYYIDNEGNILTYNNPEGWNFPDNNFNITPAQVSENLSKCKKSGKIISSAELHKYSGYIKNITSSKVTAMRNVAADAGAIEFTCYLLSGDGSVYTGYIIKKEGDFTCENLNFYSKTVVTWMKNINNSLSKN